MRLQWISQSAVESSLRFGSGACPVPMVLPVPWGAALMVWRHQWRIPGIVVPQRVVHAYPPSDVFFTEHKTSVKIMLRELICEQIKRKGEKNVQTCSGEPEKEIKDGLEERTLA